MDPRRSPRGVLNEHTEDQFPNLLRRRSPSDLPPYSGDQPPVHTKTSPVPADDGFGRDDEEGLLPSRPDPPSDYPEELIEEAQTRARISTLQRDELLTQRFSRRRLRRSRKRRTSIPKQSPTKQNIVRIYNRTVVRRQQAMLLISRSAGVLANHSGSSVSFLQAEFKTKNVFIKLHRFFEIRDMHVGFEESTEQSRR